MFFLATYDPFKIKVATKCIKVMLRTVTVMV